MGADGLMNSPSGHLGELLAVTLLDDVGDVIIYPSGRERIADRKERIHPVCSLVDLHDNGEYVFYGEENAESRRT